MRACVWQQEFLGWLLTPALNYAFTALAPHSCLPLSDVGRMATVATTLRILDSLFCEHLPLSTAAASPGPVRPGAGHQTGSRDSSTVRSYAGVTDKVRCSEVQTVPCGVWVLSCVLALL